MFEQFPYTNFHDLNLDWILKIAKDFLDQYTHIQDLVTEGIASIDTETAAKLEELNTLATELEAVLNEWYETHQNDIANRMTAAINQFNISADTKAQEALASIPSDYTTLSNDVLELQELARTTNDLKQYMHIIINRKWSGDIGHTPIFSAEGIDGRYAGRAPLKLPAGEYTVIIHPGFMFSWRTLDQNFHITTDSGYQTGTQTITADGNTWYIFGGASNDFRTITQEEAENSIEFYSMTDKIILDESTETESYKITNINNLLVGGISQRGDPGEYVYETENGGRATNVLPVKLEKGNYIVKISDPYIASYRVVNDEGVVIYSSDWFYINMPITANGQFSYHFTLGRVDNGTITNVPELKSKFDVIELKAAVMNQITDDHNIMHAISHRGENTIAPENTIPAIKDSKTGCYDMVEVDIRFTSDNVPVLLHDASINRTARNADGTAISGTVNIADITFAEALTYDFGIWKNAAYAGTRIPSLADFLKVCKDIAIKPRIELLIYDTSHLDIMLTSLEEFGMLKNVQYNINNIALIQRVLNRVPNAEIVYGMSTYDASIIAALGALKTDINRIIINANIEIIDSTLIAACMTNNLELEVWTVDNPVTASSLPSYVTGMTSNRINIDTLLYYNQNMV